MRQSIVYTYSYSFIYKILNATPKCCFFSSIYYNMNIKSEHQKNSSILGKSQRELRYVHFMSFHTQIRHVLLKIKNIIKQGINNKMFTKKNMKEGLMIHTHTLVTKKLYYVISLVENYVCWDIICTVAHK